MKHVRVLLLNDSQPTFFRHRFKWTTDRLVPHLPSHTLQYGIGIWDRTKLKLWWRWKLMAGKDGGGFGSLLGIFLPFYVSSPAWVFFCKCNFRFFFNFACFVVCGITTGLEVGFCIVLSRLIEER
jgi:hypothetical protein